MSQQTFPVGTQPRLQLGNLSGDLDIITWQVDTISLEADEDIEDLRLDGDVLYLNNCDGNVKLQVPASTALFAENVSGDVRIRGIRLIERLQNVDGDVEIEDIAESATLENLEGELEASNVSALEVVNAVEGDVTLSNVEKVELENVEGSFSVEQAQTVVVGSISGDLKAHSVTSALRCGFVQGDCNVQAGPDAEISLGQVSGDVRIEQAATVQLGSVDGDCKIQRVQHKLTLGNCSGDVQIEGVGGLLEIGAIAGDASIQQIEGRVNFGCISGDLALAASFPESGWMNGYIGGDANLSLPADVNLRIQAWINGDLRLEGDTDSHPHEQGKLIGLVYGEGQAKMFLVVGGDLKIKCATLPRNRSILGGFAQEMAGFASSMSDLGNNLTHEVLESLSGLNMVLGSRMSERLIQKIQAQMERAHQRIEAAARQSEAYANKQAEKASKFAEKRAQQAGKSAEKRAQKADKRFRYSDRRYSDRHGSDAGGQRDWPFDPVQIERLKSEAHRAANEGMIGALDAVEQALRGLHFPFSPTTPMPPTPPTSPTPPSPPPMGFGGPVPPVSPMTSPAAPTYPQPQQERPSEEAAQSEPAAAEAQSESTLDQRREAILRMIAEGRISPEEGDMLLSGLE